MFSKSDLIEQIRYVFEGTRMPSDDELLHPDCIDDVDVLEFYGGVRWQDTTDDDVTFNYAAPMAFSAIAFNHNLPAYLCWTLNHADSAEVAGESILLALNAGTDQELLHEFKRSLFGQLTKVQVEVVKAFLRHLEGHSDLGPSAKAALVNYWIDA